MAQADYLDVMLKPYSDPDPDDSPRAAPKGWTRWLALLFSLAITALIIIFRNELARFAAYGYIGVFIVSLLGNATVILPVPSLLGVFAAGTAFNPLLVGLVAGVAEPLGELTGYLAGYGGSAIIENRQLYERLSRWMQRRQSRGFLSGYIAIFVLSVIPNPLFDLAGIAAGAMRMPVRGFLISCWLGKTVKATSLALLGYYSVGWMWG